jgi:predicted membrane-bound mannosyltransferase/DNA-binding beta-propeller fold protein YncE
MLGYRVQSHDESLHCKFSWDLYAGYGFQHNPMMHGPFLFHATAFSYFLFGDNDFTARLPVALIGTLLVAFPYLLRRYLGRKGALITSLLLLISPSITYYSRYIRHDIPAILWAMIVIWAIFRYLEKGRDKHLYILAAGLSLMYATKEVAPIYTVIIAVFLVGLFLVRALAQPWERPRLETVFLAALVGIIVGLVVLSMGWLSTRAPAEQPAPPGAAEPGGEASLPFWGLSGGLFALVAFVVAAGAVLYGLWGKLRSFRTFDLIVLIGTLSLPFASPIPIHLVARLGSLVVARSPNPELISPFWSNLANVQPTDYAAPSIYYSGAVLALVLLAVIAIGLAWDRRRWLTAAAIHSVIFLVLFTTVFTNGSGIASGWVGSVGYWLEQQEVERGGQPWFYYFVILPLYDFLPLVGALLTSFYLVVRRAVDSSREKLADRLQDRAEAVPGGEARFLFIPFVVFWALLAWFGYSYAGEKMPWLVVHIALPMILLTGWLLGQLLEQVDWRRMWERKGWALVLLLPALVAALAATVATGVQGPFQGVELDALLVTGTFLGGLVGLGLVGTLVGLLWARVGVRNGFLLIALTGFLTLGLLTARVAYRLSYINFDRPAEFLVYAHEGPDVRTTMEQLEELSLRVGGGPRLIDVTYGPDGSWPFTWYLRNYPNARYYPQQPDREQVLATAVIAGREQWAAVEPHLGDDYYTFDYFYLWWPVEDYRQLTWKRLRDWLTNPRKLTALWKIFYNMDYGLYDEITDGHRTPDDWPLHSPFRLYIRKDVANRLWDFGIGPVPEPTEPEVAPYAEGWRSMSARLVWGMEGSASGQFLAPRGIAVSPDGYVYVADSRNHRIQKFTTDGAFVTAWGTFGGCPNAEPAPGTFCEPWDVAVDPEGFVYVADTWADRVQKFTSDGTFVTEWTSFGERGIYDFSGHSHFYGPRAIVVGPEGAIYVADTGHKRVQVFGSDGEFLREWGQAGSEPGQLDEPVGLAFGPEGRIYVADSWNYRLQVLEPDGDPVRSWPIAGWNNPAVEEKPYVAVDAEGRVYVTDPGHYRVLVFDAEGNYLYGFGQYGFGDTSFGLPMGVALGPEGSLYVTDASNNRVMVFDLPE